MTMSAIYAVSARRTYLPTSTAAPSFSKGLIDGVGLFDGGRVGTLQGLLDGHFYDSVSSAAPRERYFEATGADSPVFGVVRVTAWIVPKPLGLDVSDDELTWLASQAGFSKEKMLTPDGVTVLFDTASLPAPPRRRDFDWAQQFHKQTDGRASSLEHMLVVAWLSTGGVL